VTVAILQRGRTGWEIGGGSEAKVGCGMITRSYRAREGKGKRKGRETKGRSGRGRGWESLGILIDEVKSGGALSEVAMFEGGSH